MDVIAITGTKGYDTYSMEAYRQDGGEWELETWKEDDNGAEDLSSRTVGNGTAARQALMDFVWDRLAEGYSITRKDS